MFACADDSKQNAPNDVSSENDSKTNGDTSDEPEIVAVDITTKNFSKYFKVNMRYSKNQVFLYNTYTYVGNTKIVTGAMYDYFRECTATVELIDKNNKVGPYGIRGISLTVRTDTGWRGQSCSLMMDSSGYSMAIVTAQKSGEQEPAPRIDMTFTIDFSMLSGTLYVPKENVK